MTNKSGFLDFTRFTFSLLFIVASSFIGESILINDAWAADPQTQEKNTTNLKVPSPLSLEQALDFSRDHPRSKITPADSQLFPSPQPLFLDCYNRAFSNVAHIDPVRNTVSTQLVPPEAQQKLLILQAFLDVLLADLNLTYINENMAGNYIDYDKAKTRFELKQVSELVVAKLHAEYQTIRQQFHASQATQRITRSLLAQAMNRPAQLPADLNNPTVFTIPNELPELDKTYQQALKNNPMLAQIKQNGTSDQVAVAEMAVRQKILELLLRLKVLNTALEQADTEGLQRDLNLEMSRTLYEMEVQANLGDSMTLQSKARLDKERYKYCQFLAWAELNTLQGLPLLTPPPIKQQDKSE